MKTKTQRPNAESGTLVIAHDWRQGALALQMQASKNKEKFSNTHSLHQVTKTEPLVEHKNGDAQLSDHSLKPKSGHLQPHDGQGSHFQLCSILPHFGQYQDGDDVILQMGIKVAA
jgi:hypothetical protein